MKLVTCATCGWVHMGVTRAETVDSEPPKKCFCCGGSYVRMRLSKAGDCPYGCTIQSVLLPDYLTEERRD